MAEDWNGMSVGPADLSDLDRAHQTQPPWFLDLVQPEIGGGAVNADAFTALDDNPAVVALRVSGLKQPVFEELVTRYGARLEAIDFWKCPRLEDLSPLEDMPHLRLASFYWNQRSPRLWDLRRTPHLVGLSAKDFTRLHRLDDLGEGTSLRELSLGDAIWPKSTFETVEPLGGLSGLRRLSIDPQRVDDRRIQPLGRLTGLTELWLPTNLFTTEQYAWLTARLPDSVESNVLGPLAPLGDVELVGDVTPDVERAMTSAVLPVGKGKPFLESVRHAARIERHVRAFEVMVAAFRADPLLEPN